MPELFPIEALIGLLVDIGVRRVSTDDDFAVRLQVPGEPDAIVTEMAGALEREGWAYEPAQCRVWELTPAGRELLKRGAP